MLPTWYRSRTVSYTHLDVYKRQAYMLFDLFNYVDQSLFEQKSHVLKCKINGVEQPFTTVLREGDQVNIG